ncbi:MAG: membrane protein insertion efficiency factor YidD [Elusimicrobiales bacterium]|nr:membrane protein insertion efficiency factor YidD [Elusimicrobiales bacterium]
MLKDLLNKFWNKTTLLKTINLLFIIWKTIRVILGPGNCKFIPSCSYYSKEAIQKYGLIKGSYLAIKRIIKCSPFTSGGYDPIP